MNQTNYFSFLQQWELAAQKANERNGPLLPSLNKDNKSYSSSSSNLVRRSLSDSSRASNRSLINKSSHSQERPPLPPKTWSNQSHLLHSRSFRKPGTDINSFKRAQNNFVDVSSDLDKNNKLGSEAKDNGLNDSVRRPSMADLKKSLWFEKEGLTSNDVDKITLNESQKRESRSSRTKSSMTSSSTSSLVSSVSSKTITNSLSISQFSNLFKSDTSISNGKLDGSVDSVVVKLKETAIPLPPATLISIPPKPPPKLKTSSATPRSSSCPSHTMTDAEKEVSKETAPSNNPSR